MAAVRRAAEAAVGSDTRLSEAAARYLYKLMAYKDEYEVARLHRSSGVQGLARGAVRGATRRSPTSCIPPTMRRFGYGVDQKIGLGKSGEAAFAALRPG